MRGLRAVLRRTRVETGSTLAELLVAMTVLVVAGTVVGSMIVSSQQATASLQGQSQAMDALRVAMAQIEREFRSAECVMEPVPPGSGVPATGNTLRFTTRSNGGTTEVAYVVADGALTRDAGSGAGPVTTGLLDGTPAFEYLETPRRSVTVEFHVDAGDGKERVLTTTVAGRNAWRNC